MRYTVLVSLALAACHTDYVFAPDDPPLEEPPDTDVELDTDVEPETESDVEPETDVEDTDDVWIEDPLPVAEARMYAHTSDTLFDVDPVTGHPTEIAGFTLNGAPLDGIVDIAIDNDGHVFGGDRGPPRSNGPYTIYQIDPTTAEARAFCTVSVGLTALAFTSDGELVAGGVDVLTGIDLENGCTEREIFRHAGYVTSGDVVGLPDGYLYWTVRAIEDSNEDEDSDYLVAVDPRTGFSSPRRRIGFDRLYGLGYDEAQGRLYGFSSGGNTIEIVPATGQGTLLADDEDVSWWGATTNPVRW